MEHKETIAERLRKARGDTPREVVAAACGISLSAISMYENGERVPRDEIKVKLAEFYNTSVQALFF
ncbi:MAG: helix-turn-helix transcriptional regulator [Lentisphaeria bacterium]|nr:helix-turn-helix transcriptional regulator [Lentisphaeria bacterium]